MTIKHRIIRMPHLGNSFTDGMARIVDFGGALDDYHAEELVRIYEVLRVRRMGAPSGPEAEAETVRIAWDEVGQCVRKAIGVFESEGSDEHLPAEQVR